MAGDHGGMNPAKFVVLVLVAIACGFLTFNFHYIITVRFLMRPPRTLPCAA
jgi:hypothetical protein